MEIQTKLEEGKLIVSLSGDLIGDQNGVQFLEVVQDQLTKGNFHIVVDFSNVRYMNSTGLGALITLFAKIKREEGSLKIIGASEQIIRLFQITQLDKVFEVESK